MVSTRQMATSNSGASGSNSTTAGSATDESTRLSVVTRQTSSNYMLFNCSAIPSVPLVQQQQRTLMQTSGGPSSSGVSVSGQVVTRPHSHLTQALKSSGSTVSAVIALNTTTNLSQLHLLDLPIEILSQILTYVGYKKIGHLRVVSQKFNDVCMNILNSTFSKLITQTYNRFHAIKANMPRRESARRNHPLACECDIIETCYMRLSLLQMTFGKHIERGHCCFFPGAILDEVYTILNYIKNTPRLERPYRVTDELFDLSTMAMEYFRDRIESTLPDIAYFNKDFYKLPTTTKRPALVIASDLSDSSSSLPSPPQSNMVLRKGIRKIKQGMKIYNNQLSVLRSELRTCKRKSSEQGKQIAEQQKLLADQQKQTLEYANRLDENDKKNEEMSRKFSTLLQELNKCKTELQYWRSKSPAIPTCTSCGQKVAPLLPPEDYQALINQGVKPEDIIMNLNDDTDTESDASMCENNTLSISGEFVFPDEATTAKLLAVNTATNKLKRQNNHITSNMYTSSGSSTATCIDSSSADETDTAGSKPSEMTNSLDYARVAAIGGAIGVGHIIRTISCTPAHSGSLSNDLNNAAAIASNDTFDHQSGTSQDSIGYPTKLFYGMNVPHKGVIVSPGMIWAKSGTASTSSNIIADNVGVAVVPSAVSNVTNATVPIGSIAVDHSVSVEDVVSLQSIASHETKKARRVQKATRCLSGSSNSSSSGKRSK